VNFELLIIDKMDSVNHVVDLAGFCWNCKLGTEYASRQCVLCSSIICNKHYNRDTRVCELCKFIPKTDHTFVCFICECVYSDEQPSETERLDMAFSESHASIVLYVRICYYCTKMLAMPYINANSIPYQTV
jgi:hypothetical protein